MRQTGERPAGHTTRRGVAFLQMTRVAARMSTMHPASAPRTVIFVDPPRMPGTGGTPRSGYRSLAPPVGLASPQPLRAGPSAVTLTSDENKMGTSVRSRPVRAGPPAPGASQLTSTDAQ
jgi:hypothetical protein